jgi:hypothetical protein
MRSNLHTAVKAILAGSALSLASTGAFAAGGVVVKPVTAWTGSDNSVAAGQTISTVAAGLNKNAYTDNPTLFNSAWGHTGAWYNFQVTAANQLVSVKDVVLGTGTAKTAFTVWASGSNLFDGGTTAPGETSTSTNAPHSFNAVGALGDNGTVWMSAPSAAAGGGGNLLATLAYANSGNAHTGAGNDWGEIVNSGVNQVGGSGTFYTGGVTGSTGSNFAELIFQNLGTGWYTVYVGGASDAATGTNTHQLSITTASAVPLPAAVYLFGSALAGLMASNRKKRA